MYPADLKYSKEHEWVKVEGARGRIGLTHHAQQASAGPSSRWRRSAWSSR
ncbi:MAG: Glycine cleavage H-protein [candidate division NC10 bacterium]|nr:Glycine cleavage H-protein [candidate division NC10 bacterium]